jgi:anaerobic magnesium-protoporphyrin IX monomethyl ester cyclase
MHPDRGLRHAMRWYTQMGRRVWPYEILGFFRDPLRKDGPTVAQFWGAAQDAEEESMAIRPAATNRPIVSSKSG